MDIPNLIDKVNKLNSKIKDLDKIELAKKQVIEEVNRDLEKSYQLLENKVKQLETIVDNKLTTLKKMDDDLVKNRSLLAQMNNSHNVSYSQAPVENLPQENNKNAIDPENRQEIAFPQPQSQSNSINNSIEDFIVQQFQKEYKVKYPEQKDSYLPDRDFAIILSALKSKAQESGDLPVLIDEYLANYPQTINESQRNTLVAEKNRVQGG